MPKLLSSWSPFWSWPVSEFISLLLCPSSMSFLFTEKYILSVILLLILLYNSKPSSNIFKSILESVKCSFYYIHLFLHFRTFLSLSLSLSPLSLSTLNSWYIINYIFFFSKIVYRTLLSRILQSISNWEHFYLMLDYLCIVLCLLFMFIAIWMLDIEITS